MSATANAAGYTVVISIWGDEWRVLTADLRNPAKTQLRLCAKTGRTYTSLERWQRKSTVVTIHRENIAREM